MSGGVPDIICVAQIAFKFVDHALIVDNRGLLLFKSENLANLPGLKNGFNLDTNVAAQNCFFIALRGRSPLLSIINDLFSKI